MNGKGQMNLFIGLLIGFMIVTTLVALIPGLRDEITMVTSNAEGLNCKGAADYNASEPTSTTACMAFGLYIPFIVLAVLIGLVGKMLYDKGGPPQPAYYGG